MPSNPFAVGANSPFGSWAVSPPAAADSFSASASSGSATPDADGKYGDDYNPDPFSPPPPPDGIGPDGKQLPGWQPPGNGPPKLPGDGKGGGDGYGSYLFNQNPGYGIANYNSRHGTDSMSAYGSWVGRQAPALFNDYAQQTASNPNLNFEDYLDQHTGTLNDWYGVSQAGGYAPVRRGR